MFNKPMINFMGFFSLQKYEIIYDDIPSAANYIPSITSFRQPTKRFVQECFNAVIDKSDNKTILVEGELIVRKSTMR